MKRFYRSKSSAPVFIYRPEFVTMRGLKVDKRHFSNCTTTDLSLKVHLLRIKPPSLPGLTEKRHSPHSTRLTNVNLRD
jgi:hypothetical protein